MILPNGMIINSLISRLKILHEKKCPSSWTSSIEAIIISSSRKPVSNANVNNTTKLM